ncbi:MAG: hypothetical protein WC678_03930 [Parcubacteria group bacterium]|jgi:hypothetical protein
MKKTKAQGITMVASAIILIAIIIAYATFFFLFGLKSGGSILMLFPLMIITVILIIGLAGLFYAGIKFIKK